MKKLLITFLLFVSYSAWAEWELVGRSSNGEVAYYVDPTTIRRDGALRKFWKAIEKNDLKLSETEKELVKFERTFLKNLILKFLKNLNSFDVNQKEIGAFKDDSLKFKMHYLDKKRVFDIFKSRFEWINFKT
jgi:hypothetical protein